MPKYKNIFEEKRNEKMENDIANTEEAVVTHSPKYEGVHRTTRKVNFRREPVMNPSNVIRVLDGKTRVSCTGHYENRDGKTWVKAVAFGEEGYIMSDFLTKR